VDCDTCTAGYNGACQSCVLGRYLFQITDECLEICTSSHYPDTVDYKCKPCDPSCNTCTGPNPADCNECNYDTHYNFFENG